MRVRGGIFPTDSLVVGVAGVDYTVDSLSARLRRKPALRRYLTEQFDIVVSGYPRSGNSFLAEALRLVGGSSTRVGEREHSPLVPYVANRSDLPVVIPIREPVSTIASWFVFRGEELTTERLRAYVESYTRWFRFVHRYRSAQKSVVVPFEVLTKEPDEVLSHHVVQQAIDSPTASIHPEEVLQSLQHKETRERGTAFVEKASLPVEERRGMNERVVEFLEQPGLAAEVEQAQVAYLDLQLSEPSWR